MIWKSLACKRYLFVHPIEDKVFGDTEIANFGSFAPVEISPFFIIPLFIRKHCLRGVWQYQVRAALPSSPFLHVQHSFGVSGQWFSEETMHECQATERQWVSVVPAGIIGFNLQTLKTAAPTEFHPPKASARPAWITKHSLSQHAVRSATGHGNSAASGKQGRMRLNISNNGKTAIHQFNCK